LLSRKRASLGASLNRAFSNRTDTEMGALFVISPEAEQGESDAYLIF